VTKVAVGAFDDTSASLTEPVLSDALIGIRQTVLVVGLGTRVAHEQVTLTVARVAQIVVLKTHFAFFKRARC